VRKKKEIVWCNYLIFWNDIEIGSEIPFDLGNYIVRKPEKSWMKQISGHFHDIMGSLESWPNQEAEIRRDGNSLHSQQIRNQDEFRYLIIEPKKQIDSKSFNRISQGFRLTQEDLWTESSLHVCELNSNIMFHPDQVGSFFGLTGTRDLPLVVNWNSVAEIVKLRDEFNDTEFPNIIDSIQLFIDNDAIHDKSILKHLGYFAIIESLLSHSPKPNDSMDSISRQLKRNLILLNNRPNGYVDLMLDSFNGASAETIINKLYAYRSSIAHGGRGKTELDLLYQLRKPDEKDKELRLTKNQWIACYIRKLTKGVLLHALLEPQLINDLK
jgi:hypothetical protein